MKSFRENLEGYWYSNEFPQKVLEHIESGADVNESGMLGMIIEYCKSDKMLLEILKKMEGRGVHVDASIVIDLIRYCHIECLKYYVKKGLDINYKNADGWNGLFFLVITELPYGKFTEGLNELISMGIDYDIIHENNRNLIHHTVAGGFDSYYLKSICELGLDINLQDKNGWTPLHIACNNLSTEYIPILLSYGADETLKITGDSSIDNYDEALGIKGFTPLQIYEKRAPLGAEWRNERIIELLE